MSSRNLPTTELDFDQVKEELIQFLNGQEAFKDYDFTGSALNTLIDVCAYLIHYVGVQANFALRESFLESAQLRKNVSAISKELGYFPSQWKAGRASFSLSLDVNDVGVTTQITVPKGTQFVSTLETGESVVFTTYNDNPLVDTGVVEGGSATGTLRGTVYVAQGVFVTRGWEVLENNPKYVLDQGNVDTDFLSVQVRPYRDSASVEVFEYERNIANVQPSTPAFFLSEKGDSVEMYFGNNTIGKSVNVGQWVEAEFLVTEGAIANGVKTFQLTTDIDGYQRGDFTIVEGSVLETQDGADRETNESIRFLAPLSYQRQNRIVTVEDYKVAILEKYNNVKAINAWGGENAEPPEFGKVFVSIAPVYGEQVSPTTKKSIQDDVLNKFSVLGISPEIVDPEYLYVNCNTNVVYNKDRTTTKAAEMITTVQAAIEDFFSEQVFDYNQSFKYSKFLAAVDAAHPAISHSLASVTIGKKFIGANVVGSYQLKFFNAIEPGSVQSIAWENTGNNTMMLKDDYNGYIDLYVNGSLSTPRVGAVDYATGIVQVNGFNANMLVPGPILVNCTPESLDVDVRFNNLAKLGDNTVTVEVEVRS